MNSSGNWVDRLIGALLGVGALILYLATLSQGPFPGASAGFIVQNTGLFPRVVPLYPLWADLVRLVSMLPLGDLALRLNVLSALCGAASVWLMHGIMTGAIYGLVDPESPSRCRVVAAARLAAAGAALFLAFAAPFWVVSNRAHPASFHAALLLVAARLLLAYARTGSLPLGALFAFVYGLGMAESTAFIVLAIPMGLLFLVLMNSHQHLMLDHLVCFILCAVAGLSYCLIAAWRFRGTPGYELGGYSGCLHVVWVTWRHQYFSVAHSLPQIGWIPVLFVAALPWLVCVAMARTTLNEEPTPAYVLLHAAIAIPVSVMLLNLKVLPPPGMDEARAMVTPYILNAAVFGYLLAYWTCLRARWLGILMTAVSAGLLCVSPPRSYPDADARPAAAANRYANAILDSLEGRTWLVTGGEVDELLSLAARRRGIPLRIVNLRAEPSRVYMQYMASLFASPRLQNLAGVGMLPLVQEWLRTGENVEREVAVLAAPDLWIGSGLTALPNKLVFLGTRNPKGTDCARLLEEHERFWSALLPWLRNAIDQSRSTPLFWDIPRHLAFVANNLGVFLQDMGCDPQAFAAYRKAREIDPRNVSALLNLYVMVTKGFETDQAEAIRKDLDLLMDDAKTKYHIWSLSRYYGYVRMPEAFSQLGWVWTRSGQPGLAVAGVQKAMALLPEENRGPLKQTLADLYLLQEDYPSSESLYAELLTKNPDNTRALLGLLRGAARRGDFDAAAELLERAQEAGAPKTRMALEKAYLHLVTGNIAQARIVLEELTDLEPELLRAWAMLGQTQLLQNDAEGLESTLTKLRESDASGHLFADILSAEAALRNGDETSALASFREAASASRPGSPKLMEHAIRLELSLGQTAAAVRDAKDLLALDPENALGNYVAGCAHVESGDMKLAEDSLRKSVSVKPSPEALNNLAWVLQEAGRYEEAEPFARKAIEMNERDASAWDTLGVILARSQRPDEAKAALEKSTAIDPANHNAVLNLAELEIVGGNLERGRSLVQSLSTNRESLSSEQREKLSAIQARL